MRRAVVVLIVFLFLLECVAQQSDHGPVTVSGCVMSVNGTFKLLTPSRTYVLKGHQNALFGYNGKLVEVTGTVDAASKSAPEGIPVVLHVTKLKKLADFCH